jgi:hypothetical protein
VTTPVETAPPQLTAAKVAALIALIEAQSRVRAQLTAAAVQAAVAAFTALSAGDWWEADKVDRAVDNALKTVQASQRLAARTTDAYLVDTVSTMTGRRPSPAGAVDVTRLRRAITEAVARDLVDGRRQPAYVLLGEHDPAGRRVIPADTIDAPAATAVPDPLAGETISARIRRERAEREAAAVTDPAEPYGRVADGYRYQVVAEGATEGTAKRKALVRIAAVAETDVTLAVREQVRKTLGQIPGVTGYRRILHPELSETGPCGLCVVAADRIYKVEDLKPIHDRCVCEVLPIIGALDPGLNLNASELEAIYDAAGGTGGEVIKRGRRHSAALKRVRVALGEHGELGPVLVDADQRYRGPREVAKTKVQDRATRAQAQLDALEEAYARLVRRQLSGDDVERPLEWQARRIDALRRELAGAV